MEWIMSDITLTSITCENWFGNKLFGQSSYRTIIQVDIKPVIINSALQWHYLLILAWHGRILVHRLRRWHFIKPTLGHCPVAEISYTINTCHVLYGIKMTDSVLFTPDGRGNSLESTGSVPYQQTREVDQWLINVQSWCNAGLPS